MIYLSIKIGVVKNETIKRRKEKFDQICDEWLSYKKLRIKESTYSNYSFKINRYIKKDFGGKRLQDLRNEDINRYIERLQKKIIK